MSTEGNAGTGAWENTPRTTENMVPQATRPASMPQTISNSAMQKAVTYRAVYPEVYYKLKPFISMVCDAINPYGDMMLTQQQVEQIADGIYDDACKMYPEMAGYLQKYDNMKDDPSGDPPAPRGFGRPGFGFRRRGLGRDFIEALLLAELLGRRRFF